MAGPCKRKVLKKNFQRGSAEKSKPDSNISFPVSMWVQYDSFEICFSNAVSIFRISTIATQRDVLAVN